MLLFSARRRGEREAAGRIYEACLAAARRPELYLVYGVPDTYQGRFEMVAFSLFPVLNRLMLEGTGQPELARLVSERFVDDMDATFREMGVSDTAVPKRMKTLYRSFAGRISAYRSALNDADALTAAVARNVFPDVEEDRHAAALAGYLRTATDAVADADMAALRRGELPFPPFAPAATTGEPP
jgi:cytochrome b pre-mRNA-processing protein 3